MKYIRIKDGYIFKALDNYHKDCVFYNGVIINTSYFEVEKQSDNLIDLVDGVLVEEKDNPNHWFIMETDEFTETSKDEIMIKNWSYKAFIKNDKGLIYVAELKNGKLVLL